MRYAAAYFALALTLFVSSAKTQAATGTRATDLPTTDMVVIGAGIAGLSAALEAARGGARVTIIEMNSQGTGHAIMANGFAIVDTPLQQKRGFLDSPERAYAAWSAYSPDGDRNWMRFYAQNSRELIYDWVLGFGVQFDRLSFDFANRDLPRFHNTRRGAVDVVLPIYRATLMHPNVEFLMNTEVIGLVSDGGRVTGVSFRHLRSDTTGGLSAAAIVIATGGFERNLELVLEHWPARRPRPERLLTSAGAFARGSGLALASRVGASLTNLDKRYVYTYGLPDPRPEADAERSIGFTNPRGIWVNGRGRRFVNVHAADKAVFDAVMRQEPASFWIVFDRDGLGTIRPRDIRYKNDPQRYRREVLNNPTLVKTAGSIPALAQAAGLPSASLVSTVRRYNAFVAAGVDRDFGRFPVEASWNSTQRLEAPDPLDNPPYHAVRIYPNAVKSMGGIAIDADTRVLNADGDPIPGLFAAGEVTGSAGINGSHGLNGMFLGPALMTGRLAGRAVLRALSSRPDWRPATGVAGSPAAVLTAGPASPVTALGALVSTKRPGYWHFEASHEIVLERGLACKECHSDAMPQRPALDDRARLAQLASCRVCH